MNSIALFQKIAIWTIPVLFAITVHEVAHGWVANKLGDPTAKMLGRLTLNPIKHIDLLGTIIVPILLLMIGGFIFGWAKPVPITWQNLKNPRRDTALVAIAGPLANLLMALIWALLVKLGLYLTEGNTFGLILILMGIAGISINVILMVLNLLPIPPLDGSRVVASFLPGRLAYRYNLLEPFGFLILLALIFTGVLSYILYPITYTFISWISSLFGLAVI